MKSKSAITNSAIITVSLIVFLSVPILTNAQSLEPIIPGIIEGTGTYFEIKDSEYLNIVLDSFEEISLRMELMPEMITMMIKPVSSSSTTQITLNGFVPSTTYYKYQDDYHNLVSFTTDINGNYTYTQDLTNPHFVFIQNKPSTKFIKDDATGGDCYQIGIWDSLTKTCILAMDVNETIQIDNDNITVNGNNYTISEVYYGIYIFRKSNITIKNLRIETFYNGIAMFITHNSLIENNLISSYYGTGLNVRSANNNIFRGNTISNNGTGMWIGWYLFDPSSNNQIYNNNFLDNFSDIVYGPAIDNVFSLSIPIGGNYWSRFDTPEDGCKDLNNDNFCDAPHIIFISGEKVIKDDLPWTKRNGWVTKTLSEQASELAKLVINAPYLGDGDTFGGKGWDPEQALYVSSNDIFDGYNYWNNKLRTIAFGSGLDCSGLVQWAFNRSFDPSKSLLHNAIRYDGADGQYKNNSETLNEASLQPGDLLFLDKDGNAEMDHVAMYVGESGGYNIVEAYSPAEGIVPANKAEFKKRIGFVESKHFRRVIPSPSIGGQVKASSPIDIVITDPDGFIITPTTIIQTDEEYLQEVPGELYYTENVLGADGYPEDIVYWPVQKTGDYTIKVIPDFNAGPNATYGLDFSMRNQTITLAQNVPVSQIPTQGYGVTIASDQVVSTFIPVSIDVKPGSFPNSINLGSNGVVPVAIFGFANFDVKQIKIDSIRFGNATIKLKGNGQSIFSYSDLNADGFTDILVKISTEALQLTATDTKVNLEGNLIDGTTIKGSDSIRIVP
ncbi:MAG: right-handed parallel beta-helix repeat-containing protein [Patescibacteria group bacterium]